MWTVAYFPKDGGWGPFDVWPLDYTTTLNNMHRQDEGPSFCVRLWVFEMPND